SLNYFWDMRGYFREGERWITAGLSSGSAVAPVTRATALHALGHMLVRQGEYPRAHLLFQESIALFRSLPALPEAYVYALADLAFTVHQTGNTEEGRALAREATQAANASGSPRTQAWALNALGIIHTEEGAQHEAQETLEQAITISRGCGD